MKKARQLLRKENEQKRVVNRKALSQHFKDERAEAKQMAREAEKAALKKNITMKLGENPILGGIRNKKSATKKRTQKRGRKSK